MSKEADEDLRAVKLPIFRRRCLGCDKKFWAYGKFNRLCHGCANRVCMSEYRYAGKREWLSAQDC